jgi:hypothetical protein
MKIYIHQEKSLLSSPASPPSFLSLAKDTKNRNKLNKILEKLEKYIISKESIVDIYSKEGIYQVNENQMYKLCIKNEKIHENVVLKKSCDDDDDKQISLLIDDSIIQKDLVHQLPYEHVNIPLTIHKYSLNKNKNKNNKIGLLTLVIEFIENKDKKDHLKPINYYFMCDSEIGYNNLPIEDINVFLSLLN